MEELVIHIYPMMSLREFSEGVASRSSPAVSNTEATRPMWLFKYKVKLIKIQWSLKFNSSVPHEPHFKCWGAARGRWLPYRAARIHDILSLWEARAHSAGRDHDLFSASVCPALSRS